MLKRTLMMTTTLFALSMSFSAAQAAFNADTKSGSWRPAAQQPLVLTRHGEDDGPDHDAGDDNGLHGRGHAALRSNRMNAFFVARKGQDDPPDHDADDDNGEHGPGHASLKARQDLIILAKDDGGGGSGANSNGTNGGHSVSGASGGRSGAQAGDDRGGARTGGRAAEPGDDRGGARVGGRGRGADDPVGHR
jgi:hypothetical protein